MPQRLGRSPEACAGGAEDDQASVELTHREPGRDRIFGSPPQLRERFYSVFVAVAAEAQFRTVGAVILRGSQPQRPGDSLLLADS